MPIAHGLVLAMLINLVACGQSDNEDIDASLPDAHIPDDAADECHGLVNTGAVIVSNRIAEPRPNGLGGVISDGTYERIGSVIYTGNGGATGPYGSGVAETHRYQSGEMAQVSSTPEGTTRALFEYTTDGTSIVYLFVCPDIPGSPSIDSYTATSTNLFLYGTADGDGLALEYSLVQP